MMEPRDSAVNEEDWSNLPSDLLACIAEGLGLIELLSFRGVCKNWRSSSATASAEIECEPDSYPWFLAHECLEGECSLYNVRSDKLYYIYISEIADKTCLSSDQGWLLLMHIGYHNVFFFCPFSGARIELPECPDLDGMTDHVGAFSCPPTSDDCIVSVICSHKDTQRVKIYLIRRGETEWTMRNQQNALSGLFGSAVFVGETFYFIDSDINRVLAFDLTNRSFTTYRLVRLETERETEVNGEVPPLPFIVVVDMLLGGTDQLDAWMDLGDHYSIDIRCTVIRRWCYNCVIRSESYVSRHEDSEELEGIWIQPRFFQLRPGFAW